MISQGERPFAVGILLQWFWSSVTLTGNETLALEVLHTVLFWSSVTLTGNETSPRRVVAALTFWSSVTLTGNETGLPSFTPSVCFGAVSP